MLPRNPSQGINLTPEMQQDCRSGSVCAQLSAGAPTSRADMEHAESEDRTHDLGIMRPTRYQLRYFRPAGSAKSVAIHVMLLEAAARNLSCI